MTLTNWAGSHRYRAAEVVVPRSIEELCGVLDGRPVKVIGTRHTFSDIGDSARLVSVAGLGERFTVAADRRTVRIDGAMTYGRLCELLRDEGLALANLASLPHISVAGAVATATHGSGLGNGNLATSVRSLTLATGDGPLAFDDDDDRWPGLVISLGALGPVVELTLGVEPAFDVAQTVYRGLRWDELTGSPDAVFELGYSVSLFTRFDHEPGSLWVKRRMDDDRPPTGPSMSPVTEAQHPIAGHEPDACTEQLGVPGLWSDRLPHFRLGFAPSSGDEIQSEYFVAFADAAAAIEAMRGVAGAIAPALLVSELRTVAADDLWMSPQGEGPTLALHFTWRRDPILAAEAARTVEQALQALQPRPHWGKYFSRDLDVGSRYRHRAEFLLLRDQLDPSRAFVNPWFDRVVRR